MHWLAPPTLRSDELTRQAALLLRLLKVMAALALVGALSSLLDPHNDLKMTALFYGVVLLWLAVMSVIVRRGHVTQAAWFLGFFFWALIAVVTLYFGGMQGQNASTFAVCILLIGGLVGGRPALAMATMSSLWCAWVAYLEVGGRLPSPLGPYSPVNAWGALTVTVMLTSVLLKESLDSLRRMHAKAEQSSAERDEALQRSIQGQKMELVGNLTSGIAHDFNNLLTVISSASQSLREALNSPSEENQLILNDLDDAAARAALMTRQLLTLGRPHSEDLEVVSLSKILSAMGKMLPRLLGSRIEVTFRIEEGVLVHASRTGLEQLLLNLAVNARDAMPEGGKFTVELAVDAGEAILSTSDTGVGIAPEVQRRIFEPFFTTKATGTGLGLATVQQHVSLFRGTIKVKSSVGAGTTFEVRLPLASETPSQRRPALITTEAKKIDSQMRGRIVLVEDDPLVRRAITRFLSSENFEVIGVTDGEEGYALLQSATNVDCVLTDLSMPRLDGEQLALRLAESQPDLPVIMMSGNREPRPEVMQSPGRRFLAKPLDHKALLNLLVEVTSPEEIETP